MIPAVIIRKMYKNTCFKYLRTLVWSHSSQAHSRPRNLEVLIRRSRLFVSCHLWEYRWLIWELQRQSPQPYLLFSKPMAARNHIHFQPGSEPKTWRREDARTRHGSDNIGPIPGSMMLKRSQKISKGASKASSWGHCKTPSCGKAFQTSHLAEAWAVFKYTKCTFTSPIPSNS